MSILLWSMALIGQEAQVYRIYNNKGKEVTFEKMADDLISANVVLFGELHNDPIIHWLQLRFSKAVVAGKKKVVFGAEMFERDDQLVIDEYLKGSISLENLKKEAKLWPNFTTDYLPLLNVAKEHKRPFVAANVPRRYASAIAKGGINALDTAGPEVKKLIGSLPYKVTENDSGYSQMKKEMGFHGPGMNVENMIAAQALKDHTMAESILNNWKPGELFIHFNGSYHSQKFAGIYNYLKAANAKLNVKVIAAVEAGSLDFDEKWRILGDYIIVVPDDMCKTH